MSVSSKYLYIVKDVELSETTMIEKTGTGYTEWIYFQIAAGIGSQSTTIRVYCDEREVFRFLIFDLNAYGFTASTPGISLMTYAVGGICAVLLTLKWHFRRNLKLTMKAQTVTLSGVIRGGLTFIEPIKVPVLVPEPVKPDIQQPQIIKDPKM